MNTLNVDKNLEKNFKNIQQKDLVLESDNYIDDQKILKYCSDNPNDPKCDCINLHTNIKLLQINSFSPYLCWYSECLHPKKYKTSLIREEQSNCNITNCNIKLEDIFIDTNGKLTIENNCGSFFSENTNIVSQSLLDKPIINDYVLPNYFLYSLFPVILGLCLVCFLLK